MPSDENGVISIVKHSFEIRDTANESITIIL